MATDTLTASEVDLDRLAVDTVRVLATDAIQKASSGHPSTAMALAPRPPAAAAGPAARRQDPQSWPPPPYRTADRWRRE